MNKTLLLTVILLFSLITKAQKISNSEDLLDKLSKDILKEVNNKDKYKSPPTFWIRTTIIDENKKSFKRSGLDEAIKGKLIESNNDFSRTFKLRTEYTDHNVEVLNDKILFRESTNYIIEIILEEGKIHLEIINNNSLYSNLEMTYDKTEMTIANDFFRYILSEGDIEASMIIEKRAREPNLVPNKDNYDNLCKIAKDKYNKPKDKDVNDFANWYFILSNAKYKCYYFEANQTTIKLCFGKNNIDSALTIYKDNKYSDINNMITSIGNSQLYPITKLIKINNDLNPLLSKYNNTGGKLNKTVNNRIDSIKNSFYPEFNNPVKPEIDGSKEAKNRISEYLYKEVMKCLIPLYVNNSDNFLKGEITITPLKVFTDNYNDTVKEVREDLFDISSCFTNNGFQKSKTKNAQNAQYILEGSCTENKGNNNIDFYYKFKDLNGHELGSYSFPLSNGPLKFGLSSINEIFDNNRLEFDILLKDTKKILEDEQQRFAIVLLEKRIQIDNEYKELKDSKRKEFADQKSSLIAQIDSLIKIKTTLYSNNDIDICAVEFFNKIKERQITAKEFYDIEKIYFDDNINDKDSLIYAFAKLGFKSSESSAKFIITEKIDTTKKDTLKITTYTYQLRDMKGYIDDYKKKNMTIVIVPEDIPVTPIDTTTENNNRNLTANNDTTHTTNNQNLTAINNTENNNKTENNNRNLTASNDTTQVNKNTATNYVNRSNIPEPVMPRSYSSYNIFFETNNAMLKSESFILLDQLAEELINNPDYKIEIIGHTDSDGSAIFNMQLSEKRTEIIIKYLSKVKGINQNRFTSEGKGETEPILENTSPENKQLNRRVEIIIINNN